MAKHVVKVVALLLKNGKMAKGGEIIDDDHVENLETRVKEGYLEVVKGDQKKDEGPGTQTPKQIRTKLLADYKEEFLVEAPEKATDAAIKKALKDKKALAVE